MKFKLESITFTPAGTNEHPLTGSRVGDGSVVVNESGVKGHTVHIESHRRELDTEGEMMPLTVTHLQDGENMESTKSQKNKKSMWGK